MTLWSPPPVPAFAGNPTTAIMDSLVQAPLGFQTTGIAFRAERHASQSLSSGSNTIDFDTVLEDPYSGWNSGSFKWFAPYSGWYEVTVTASISVPGSALTLGALIISPGVTMYGAEVGVFTSYPGIVTACQIVGLLSGGWIQGGINCSASATTNTTSGRYSTLEISYVSQ